MASGEFPSEESLLATGDKLNEYLKGLEEQGEDRTSIVYGKLLAERIGEGVIPLGYLNVVTLLSYDMQTGINSYTGEPMPRQLRDLPPVMFAALEMTALRRFAPGAFGDEFRDEVEKESEAFKQFREQGEQPS